MKMYTDFILGKVQKSENEVIVTYHIPDMIPVALPPRVAGDGLKEHSSYFV